MFTGLVEKVSKVENLVFSELGAKVFFESDFADVKIGDSIAINGVCLTVTSIKNNIFSADIMKETLNVSNLKNLKKGDEINLERALRVNSRLDGHIVSGHIDTIACVRKIKQDGFSKRVVFDCNSDLIINKGSIAINGVSLTVSDVFEKSFEVSLIPTTLDKTNLKKLKIGDIVNIEYDLLGKYVHKFLSLDKEKSKITLEFLKENGF